MKNPNKLERNRGKYGSKMGELGFVVYDGALKSPAKNWLNETFW